MKIGGFQKTSMIDFPGLVSCVVFTSGCNFICPYCHNPDLAAGKFPDGENAFISEQEIHSFLGKRKKLLDGVVISGGEPTLQKDLENFCLKIKSMGYQVKLDTNGSNPQILEDLFQKKFVDFIAMDIKTNLKGYGLVAGMNFKSELISESIELIRKNAPGYEFRTTCVKPLIDKDVIKDIGKMIQGTSHYVIQQCSQNIRMLNPDFFKGKDLFFSDDEILDLKSEVENYVKNCSIR